MTTSEEQLFLERLDKKLWTAADKLRSTLDAAQYKHAVLGLVFLKYVSDSFDHRRQEIEAMLRDDDHDYGVIRSNYDSDSEYEATVPFQHESLGSKDILGHVYEYFLGQFALAEGKKGGQFYTPKAIVTLIVEMLEPFQGRVYDPANSFTNDQHPDLRADYVMANPQGPGRERPGGMHGGAAGAVVHQYADSGLYLVFE